MTERAQKVMEKFLWEPKFSKRDEKLALIRLLKEIINQYGKFIEDYDGLGHNIVYISDILEVCEELEEL